MIIDTNKSKGIHFVNIILLTTLSLGGFILELLAVLDSKFKITGVLGDLFYVYLFLIESLIFLTCLFYFLKDSPKYYSYNLVGTMLAIVGTVLNVLTVFAHFLLSIPPLSEEPYVSSWTIWNDLSLIIVVGYPFFS